MVFGRGEKRANFNNDKREGIIYTRAHNTTRTDCLIPRGRNAKTPPSTSQRSTSYTKRNSLIYGNEVELYTSLTRLPARARVAIITRIKHMTPRRGHAESSKSLKARSTLFKNRPSVASIRPVSYCFYSPRAARGNRPGDSMRRRFGNRGKRPGANLVIVQAFNSIFLADTIFIGELAFVGIRPFTG